MTEQELQALELVFQRLENTTNREVEIDAILELAYDVTRLLAEVRRLQALIHQAEWKGCFVNNGQEEYCCPWCHALEPYTGIRNGGGHEPTCTAFPPSEAK